MDLLIQNYNSNILGSFKSIMDKNSLLILIISVVMCVVAIGLAMPRSKNKDKKEK